MPAQTMQKIGTTNVLAKADENNAETGGNRGYENEVQYVICCDIFWLVCHKTGLFVHSQETPYT